MKLKWSSKNTKWSIACFCIYIIGHSVWNDYRYQEKCEEEIAESHYTDSLIQANMTIVDSLRFEIRVMNDYIKMNVSRIDSTFQKHTITVDNATEIQNGILYQINRKLNH